MGNGGNSVKTLYNGIGFVEFIIDISRPYEFGTGVAPLKHTTNQTPKGLQMPSTQTFAGLVAAGALALAVSSANAALIVDDGSGGYIPDSGQTNDVLGDSTATGSAGFGANLYYDGATRVRFTFEGFEAGFDNDFSVGGSTIFSNRGGNQSSIGASVDFVFGAGASDGTSDGLLSFSFTSGGGGSVVNGSNPELDSSTGVNFFVATDTEMLEEGLFLAFDDIAAATDDEDHDDMVIRVEELAFEDESLEQVNDPGIEQIRVPVPGTLALAGAGLLGLRRALRQRQT